MRYFKTKFSFQLPFLDLSEKKNWEIPKFKIYIKMTSANMTS